MMTAETAVTTGSTHEVIAAVEAPTRLIPPKKQATPTTVGTSATSRTHIHAAGDSGTCSEPVASVNAATLIAAAVHTIAETR